MGGAEIVFAAVVIAIILASRVAKAERERREAMHALATQMGFGFVAADVGLDERMRVLMGDYRFKITTSNGKSTTTKTYDMSFISVVPARRITEELAVRGENFLDRIGAFVGFDDIDFESSEFSKRFHVKCSDRRFAFDLFDPRMTEYFLGSAVPEIEADG